MQAEQMRARNLSQLTIDNTAYPELEIEGKRVNNNDDLPSGTLLGSLTRASNNHTLTRYGSQVRPEMHGAPSGLIMLQDKIIGSTRNI